MAIRVDIDLGFRIISGDDTTPRQRNALFNLLRRAPFRKKLGWGTGDGQVDVVYHRSLAIGAGATVTRKFIGELEGEFDGELLTFGELVGGGVINVGDASTKVIAYGPLGHADACLAFVEATSDARRCYPGLSISDPGLDLFYAPRGVAVGVGDGDGDTWRFTNKDPTNAIAAEEASFFLVGRSE